MHMEEIEKTISEPLDESLDEQQDMPWLYWGLFIHEKDKRILVEMANRELMKINRKKIPNNWEVYCDHITVVYNDGSTAAETFSDRLNGMSNMEMMYSVSKIGFSERVIAFGVEGVISQNEQPHITIAVAPGAKPVESNYIKNWYRIEPFSLFGTMMQKMKR